MEKKKKIKVLVVSYLPWRNDVSVGNTLSNIFNGLEDKMEFASVYFKGGQPDNHLANHYFYIPEKQLAKSIISRKSVGQEVVINPLTAMLKEQTSASYNKARQLRWESMLLAQDIIGLLGKWQSDRLEKFVEEYHPDIIFGPLGRVPVANNVMAYLHDKYDIPLIVYAWDDHYSLNKKAISPFFWIKTFVERRYIKHCADRAEFLYTITEQMQQEYMGYFDKKCKVLYKGFNFNSNDHVKKQVGMPKKLVYMGNIGAGRWEVLEKVVKAAERINSKEKKVEVFIYTMSPKSSEIEECLNRPGTSRLMPPVPNSEVMKTMQSADILLHVEPTNQRERSFFRLSFSTKLVDYLYSARCILATGGDTAAMGYLKKNDAAIVELNMDSLESTLSKIIENEEILYEYAQKAWECGVRNHQLQTIQDGIYQDFVDVMK